MFLNTTTRGAAAALLILLSACNSEGNLFAPDRPSGQSGGNTSSPLLLGTWETVIIISTEDDLQTWTTRWTFGVSQLCRYVQETESLLEGFPRLEERPCTWTAANSVITVTFTDNGEVLPMEYDFEVFDPNRLVLDDILYLRLP